MISRVPGSAPASQMQFGALSIDEESFEKAAYPKTARMLKSEVKKLGTKYQAAIGGLGEQGIGVLARMSRSGRNDTLTVGLVNAGSDQFDASHKLRLNPSAKVSYSQDGVVVSAKPLTEEELNDKLATGTKPGKSAGGKRVFVQGGNYFEPERKSLGRIAQGLMQDLFSQSTPYITGEKALVEVKPAKHDNGTRWTHPQWGVFSGK
jgi:hypothetical protein